MTPANVVHTVGRSSVLVWSGLASLHIGALACFLVSPGTAQAQGTSTLTNFNANGDQITRFDALAGAIDAHDGEIAQFDGVFYLYGTSYDCGYEWQTPNAPFCGFKAYSSVDLVNWMDRGFLFDAQTPVWQSRCNGSTYGCYRPHVVHNKTNNLYVLWINVYDNRVGYRVFTSPSPVGPFTEIGEPTLAVNNNAPVGGVNNGDHDLFVDDDDTAYLIYTDWRAGGAIVVEKLNADYTSGTGQYVYVTSGATEAPAMMKRNGKYYILYSDPNCGYCTTGTSYRTATSPLGPWSGGVKISNDSCGGQPSFVSTIKLDSDEIFLCGSDLWNNGAKNEGLANFYWAPLTFAANGDINPITCQDKVTVAIQPDLNPNPAPPDLDVSSGSAGFTRYYDIAGNIQRSQSFVVTQTGILSAVSFCTFQTGHPDAGLTIEIYQASAAGLPIDSPISSTLVLPESIGWSPRFVTAYPRFAVNAGEAYAIVVRSTTSTGHYGLEYNDSAPYPAGKEAYSSNGGGTFTVEQNRSLMFRTFIQTLSIATTNETGPGSGTFHPSWTVQTNGSLIAGQLPGAATGNFSLEAAGRSVRALTMSNDMGITLISGTNGPTCSTNYVTCGNSGGAGASLIYSLPDNVFGYDLTNITVYGGWASNQRDQQAYSIHYSTTDAPSNFLALGSVDYNPPVMNSVQSATRVTITSSSGVLAKNVAAVKFDFTDPASESGFCGYSALEVFGVPTTNLPTIIVDTTPFTATDVVGSSVTFTVGVSGKLLSCQWQEISGGVTEDIAGATNVTLTLTNLQLSDTASYRLHVTNVYGSAVSTPSSLTVNSVPQPVNNVITAMASQIGSGSGTFYPSWTVQTNGSLIAGQLPRTTTGNFSLEAAGRSVAALTMSNDLGITLINGPGGVTSSTNYVTCGNGFGAGSTLIYSLPDSSLGYDLTNVTVYGGWASNGRDQQAYTVLYSTVWAPSSFTVLGTVDYDPSNPASAQSATRAMLTTTSEYLATNVAAVKFDFTSPASENGYCGYGAITAFGSPTLPPAVPAVLAATRLGSPEVVLNVGSLVAGRPYELQSTTNLMSVTWITETNFVPLTSTAILTNQTVGATQKFYRMVSH